MSSVQKIALYKGTLMSLVLLEEKLASLMDLQVWECSCGSKFMTVYYASFHCEKYHKGEKFKDILKIRNDLSTDTKQWNLFYTSASDIIATTRETVAIPPCDPPSDKNKNMGETERILKDQVNTELKKCKREPEDQFDEDAVRIKRLKISHASVGTNTDPVRTTVSTKTCRKPEKPRASSKDGKQETAASGFRILRKTETQSILASNTSGITEVDHLLLKIESDESYESSSLLIQETLMNNSVDAVDVSTQTTPSGIQIDFILINSKQSIKSESNVETESREIQTDLNESSDMELDSLADSNTAGDEECTNLFSLSQPSTPEEVSQYVYPSVNIPRASSKQMILQSSSRKKALLPTPDLLNSFTSKMIMRPELPFPIPDPDFFPYPYFGLVYGHRMLFHADDTPTVFHWQKRAEYYMEIQARNLDPEFIYEQYSTACVCYSIIISLLQTK